MGWHCGNSCLGCLYPWDPAPINERTEVLRAAPMEDDPPDQKAILEAIWAGSLVNPLHINVWTERRPKGRRSVRWDADDLWVSRGRLDNGNKRVRRLSSRNG